jgi:hypothetical protein
MIVFLVPAVVAGLLGVLAQGAEIDADYLPRLRFMFLGSAVLGYLGMAIFTWRRLGGVRRWGALLWGLVAARACYLPAMAGALVVTGWLEWLAGILGAGSLAAGSSCCCS